MEPFRQEFPTSLEVDPTDRGPQPEPLDTERKVGSTRLILQNADCDITDTKYIQPSRLILHMESLSELSDKE
jgi:hypothetical protein